MSHIIKRDGSEMRTPANVGRETDRKLPDQSMRWAIAVLIAATLVRLILLNWPSFYIGVEAMTVPGSFAYVERGHFDPVTDHSIPFSKILQYPTLNVFGDTAVGRRLPNAIFGALTAFFLVLLGQALFPGRRVGLIAGLLLATDPFHLSFSRSTWEDIPAALFIVMGLYFFSKALAEQRQSVHVRYLLFTGLALTLAVATRLYSVAILAAILSWLVVRETRGPQRIANPAWRRRLAFLGAIFVVLPLVFHLATYYPWFARGNSLTDWIHLQKHVVYESVTDVNMEDSEFGKYYGGSYRAIDWFTKPVVFGSQMPAGDASVATQLTINNPASWLLILPVFLWLAYKYYVGRDINIGIIVASFILLYAPFLLAQRIILIYSALAVLPVALIMLAKAIDTAWLSPIKPWRSLAQAVLGIILCANLVLYPLATAMPMPEYLSRLIPFQENLQR